MMTNKNENGFTLIEILVAVIVLAIALTPIIVGLAGALDKNVDIEKKTRTAFLAQKKLEEIKVKSIANFDVNYSNATAIAFPAPDTDFKYKVIYPNPFVSTAGIRSINIDVWYDGNHNNAPNAGEDRTILYTRAAKRGEPE